MRNILHFTPLLFLFQVSLAQTTTPIYINEFMASNGNTISDDTDEYEDWFEIYNALTTPFDLSGYFLSDDIANLTKYEIPSNTVISGGGFILFWASGESSRGNTHTNFQLSASQGEYLILTAPNGTFIIDSVHFGPQTTDVSFGRFPNGNDSWAYFKNPTPNQSNNGATPFTTVLQPPIFSIEGGFIGTNFFLSIAAPDSGVTIYYTLDGSEPNPANIHAQTYIYKNQYPEFPSNPVGPPLTDSIQSFLYTDSISIQDRNTAPNRTSNKSSTFEFSPAYIPNYPVRKGTVVRAIATRADAISSEITTETYFVGADLQNQYSLPVVSLSIDENLLFDIDEGIYNAGSTFENWRANSNGPARGNSPANWGRNGKEYEYRMGFEYFNTQGDKEFGQLVGARIHGGFSRARRRKSFRLYARSEYGKSEFNFPIFSKRNDTEYKRLLLRNSGNDERNTNFRDAFIQNLVTHLSFDIQQSEATVVFINGEYWGVHNFREWQNRHYIERLYGVESHDLDFIAERMDVQDGDSIHFSQLLSFVTNNDLVEDSLFAHLETLIDVENFTDYIIAQVYSRNSDWPTNNVKWWRKRVPFSPTAPEGHDGRWRWLAYDMDFGFGWFRGMTEVGHNTLQLARDNAEIGILLRNMWPNEAYREYFVNRYADLMNTCFLPSHVHAIVDSFVAIYLPEKAEHTARWQYHSNVNLWMNDVNLIKSWSNARSAHARDHLKTEFSLPNEHQLNVNVSDTLRGYIQVNTIEIHEQTVGVASSPYPWNGRYFENNPITLKAHPKHGYIFTHWEIGGQMVLNNPIQINMLSDTLAIAHFDTDSNIVCGMQASHSLYDCSYIFEEWSSQSAPGSSPTNMEFVFFYESDPSDTSSIAGITSGAFNLTSRTRINGLNTDGIGFINTGNSEGNIGYPGTQLGGAVLYLNTENINQAFVQFTAGTIEPGSRVYHLRLQYRLGDSGPWINLLDSNGNAIEYQRNANFNHSEIIGPHPLPSSLMGRECLQLMWRYYHTGERLSQSSGTRDFIRLDDIIVAKGEAPLVPITTAEGTGAGRITGKLAVAPGETEGYEINPFTGANYHWTVTNGNILAGQNTPQISVQWGSNGVGSLSVEVNDATCERRAEATINISGIRTDNFGKIDKVIVFPNPAKDSFQIHLPKNSDAKHLWLIDGSGRVVLHQELNTNSEIEIKHRLPAGKYFLQIANDTGGIIHRQNISLLP